ncbi:hypothetical protein BDN72DRAFT_344826 [Pluteus cervinus]|uniref:Uncharacterized protein n=1 Tax=Pluteus cervinus TaxID=181527 RepID=A0ACD3B349_9AGAR|nr:hypothetical protein BDN72DRAFT_344826 [Pluteus cervinus]
MRTLGPEDILADWKNMKLLARVLIDNELLDETEACLPLIYKGVGARPTARWELGSLQVPVDCPVFTLIITTAGRFQIFSFKVERGSDGMWDMGDLKYERICLRFRAQVLLCHPPSCFHRGGYTTPIGRVVPWAGIPPAKPWDKRIGSLDWILDFLPAERLILLGFQHYFQAQLLPRDSGHMKHAIATFERALENPNIDPGLSQVLETIIPFLYCLEQGYSSCLDVALQVLETFPGLLAEQRNVQVLLHTVVAGVVQHFEWHDHIPLAIKSIVGPLRLLHSTSPLPWTLFAVWVKLAYCHAPGAKEVLPLMDLVVEFHSSFSTSEGFESLPMMRAIVYFMQACKPGGPSLGMTLEAAEFVMHSLAAGEHSLHPVFYDWSTTWLVTAIGQNMIGPNLPYSDRLLSFIEWRSSNVPSPEDELVVMVFKSYLMGTPTRGSIIMTMGMSQATTLGDNDKRFIEKVRLDLTQQARGKEIFAEYPKGKLPSPWLSFLSFPFRCGRVGEKPHRRCRRWVMPRGPLVLRNSSDDCTCPSSP